MRAGHTQSLLQAVRRRPAEVQRAIFDKIGPGLIDEIESRLPLVWVPMSMHMDVSDAIRDVVGPQRNVELWRQTMRESFQKPFLRGFVAMAKSLFGVTPLSLLRKGANIYEHLTRDVGQLRFELTADNEGVVHLYGFPAKHFRFICYIEGLQGCLLAVYDIAEGTGTVVVDGQDEQRGDVHYRLSWR